MKHCTPAFFLVLCGAVTAVTAVAAPAPEPQPLPPAAAIVAPRDIAYPRVLRLMVDATDVSHRIFTVRETIPVAGAGDLVLLYPQWLPGTHAPTGTIDSFAGLIVSAAGAPLVWHRDPVNVFAFHVLVPRGISAVELEFQYLSPVKPDVGTLTVAKNALVLDWNTVVLYPAGYFSRRISIKASIRLLSGWSLATALDKYIVEGATTTFQPVSVDMLVDSPLMAGRYFKRYDMSPDADVPVHLDVVADDADLTDIAPPLLDLHRSLVRQAYRLFGAHHYDHYDFLCSLSDTIGFGITLEHQRSAEYGLPADEFSEWDKNLVLRDLLPHEYVHSWDGKFRRPADLWTPNFNVPMRDSLLWVYEGATEYWGRVLTARAGLWTKTQALDSWANLIAGVQATPGRQWRSLADTTSDEIINPRRPMSFRSWQRFEDYYPEGALIWMDADTLIRERSHGARSLDDFAMRFFGVENGRFTPVVYRLEDIVHALNSVEPYDWAKFLHDRLELTGGAAPLDGLTRGGYRLVFTDSPGDYTTALEHEQKNDDFWFSLGFDLNKDGELVNTLWGSPAYKAGMIPGTHLVAVNGTAYNADKLRTAIKNAKVGSAPLELLVRSDDQFHTFVVDYHGGLRYAHLERLESAAALLDDIFAVKP